MRWFRKLILTLLAATIFFAAAIGVLRYLYWDSNDWPKIFSAVRNNCNQQGKCVVNLAEIYPFEWSYVVAFPEEGERGYKEKVIGQKLKKYDGSCQGLVFLDKNGAILKEEYSGCFEEFFSFDRRLLVRFKFGDDNYFKLNRSDAVLCALPYKSSTAGDFYGYLESQGLLAYELREMRFCSNRLSGM